MTTNTPNNETLLNTENLSLSDNEERFACNICFESVKSPVTTRCGHLYCWPCLYIWLEPGMNHEERRYLGLPLSDFGVRPDAARRICPVCKSACCVNELIPIYVREKEQKDIGNEHSKLKSENEVDETKERVGNEKSEDIKVDINDIVDFESPETIDNHSHIDSENITQNDLGLRRRRTQTPSSQTSSIHPMPSRPLPPPSTIQPNNTSTLQNNHIMSAQGYSPALALHQSLFQALVAVQTNPQSSMMNQHQNSNFQRSIPSLHNRYNVNGMNASNNNSSNHGQHYEEDNQLDATQEFLSRLLLMLGCFVILCLLLF
jgi:hypothetical protein